MTQEITSVKKNLVNSRNPLDIRTPKEILDDSQLLHKALASAILSGEVEPAAKILRKMKCSALIPGTNYGTAKSIADYYGVTEQYTRGILLKYNIKNTTCDCVLREYPSNFLKKYGDGSCRYESRSRAFISELGNGKVQTIDSRGLYYDARVILAFACLAVQCRRTVTNSVANKVMKNIEKSKIAKAVIEERSAANRKGTMQAAVPATMASPMPSTVTISVRNDGVVMSHGDFMTLVQAIQAASVPSPTVPQENHNTKRKWSRQPITLPDNWDSVMVEYSAGNINAVEAARLTGMCCNSFRKYAKKSIVEAMPS